MERVVLQPRVVLWMLLSLVLKYHTEMMMEATRLLVLVSVMQCAYVTQCVHVAVLVLLIPPVLSTYL